MQGPSSRTEPRPQRISARLAGRHHYPAAPAAVPACRGAATRARGEKEGSTALRDPPTGMGSTERFCGVVLVLAASQLLSVCDAAKEGIAYFAPLSNGLSDPQNQVYALLAYFAIIVFLTPIMAFIYRVFLTKLVKIVTAKAIEISAKIRHVLTNSTTVPARFILTRSIPLSLLLSPFSPSPLTVSASRTQGGKSLSACAANRKQSVCVGHWYLLIGGVLGKSHNYFAKQLTHSTGEPNSHCRLSHRLKKSYSCSYPLETKKTLESIPLDDTRCHR